MSRSRRFRDIVAVIDIEVGNVKSITGLGKAMALLADIETYCQRKRASLEVIQTILQAEALEHPKS